MLKLLLYELLFSTALATLEEVIAKITPVAITSKTIFNLFNKNS